MARCKDCIHYEACLTFSKFINSARDVEKGCECFKDRTGVVEVVHGEWIEDYETFVDDSGKESYPIQTGYVCSECGKDGYPNWRYCPNCGAKNGRLV